MLAAHAGRLPGRHGEVHDKPGNGTVETTGSVALASGPAVFLGCAKDVALFLGLDCRLAPSAAKLDAAVDGAARSLRRLGFSEEAVGRAVWAILGGAVDDSPLREKRSPLSGHTQKATVIETPMGRMSVQDLLVAILQ